MLVLEKREMWWLVKRVENDEEGLVPAVYMHSEPPTGMNTATMSGMYIFNCDYSTWYSGYCSGDLSMQLSRQAFK